MTLASEAVSCGLPCPALMATRSHKESRSGRRQDASFPTHTWMLRGLSKSSYGPDGVYHGLFWGVSGLARSTDHPSRRGGSEESEQLLHAQIRTYVGAFYHDRPRAKLTPGYIPEVIANLTRSHEALATRLSQPCPALETNVFVVLTLPCAVQRG